MSCPYINSASCEDVSMMTKSGLFKDQRDTPQRRVRHRDGRQLKAGMGLTTGLGWSDSEDEDAPSPLTRRLSTLNLSRQKSTSSLRSSTLSRSQSKGTLHEEEEIPPIPRRPIARSRPSIPPTSWNSNNGGGGARASTGSVGSQFSLTLSIPEEEIHEKDQDSKPSPCRPSDASGHTSKSKRDAALDTPSPSSTASLPMPLTPDDAPTQLKVEKDKVLPPLPGGGLSKYQPSLGLPTSSVPGHEIEPRERRGSNTSSVSSSGAITGHILSTVDSTFLATPSPSYVPRTAAIPRPLRLSQSQTLLSRTQQPGEVAYRPGQVLTYNRNVHDQQRSRVISGPARPVPARGMSAPNTPTMPNLAKPMPRTGTGMVYRTSSNPGRAPPSRMRLPSVPPTRTSSVPRPIAL